MGFLGSWEYSRDWGLREMEKWRDRRLRELKDFGRRWTSESSKLGEMAALGRWETSGEGGL